MLSRIEHDTEYDKVDGAIAYFNKAVSKYPEFKNEKYIRPTVIQLMMSQEYKTYFSTEIIGIAEYQPGGLTASGRKIRIESPKSMLVYTHYMQDPQFSILNRIKYGIMANAYKEFLEGNPEGIQGMNLRIPKIYSPFGKILASVWKIKDS